MMLLLFSCWIKHFPSLLLCSFEVLPRKCKLKCTWKPLGQKWEQPVSGETGAHVAAPFKIEKIDSFSCMPVFSVSTDQVVFFRALAGGRALRGVRTRHRGNLWAVPAEPPPLPLAPACLRTGGMQVLLAFSILFNFFCLCHLIELWQQVHWACIKQKAENKCSLHGSVNWRTDTFNNA